MPRKLYSGLAIFLFFAISVTTYKVISDNKEIAEIERDITKQVERQQRANKLATFQETETPQDTLTTTPVEFQTAETPTTAKTFDRTTETEKTINQTNSLETENSEINRVSPFGFGEYPEIPKGFREKFGQPIWYNPANLPENTHMEAELISRVMIKRWNEGDTQFTSGVLENGKVYLNYPNTMYVRYKHIILPDGTAKRYISSSLSGEKLPLAKKQIREGKIPDGVILIDMDSKDVGIEPFSFLKLE